MRSLNLPSLVGVLCLCLHPPLEATPAQEFSSTDDIIQSLAVFDQEKLLCSRENSGFIYLSATEQPTFYNQKNENFAFSNVQQVAFTSEGDWLIGHIGGIAKKEGEFWTNWDTSTIGLTFDYNNMTAIRTAPDGWLAVGTQRQGVAVFNGFAWRCLNIRNSPLPSNNIQDIAFGPNNCLYFATTKGLAVCKGNNWKLYTTATTGIPDFTNLTSVAVLTNGDVWVTFSTNRVALLREGIWSHLNLADLGVPDEDNLVGKLYVDNEKRLWISSSQAISVLDQNGWNHFTSMKIHCQVQAPEIAVDGSGQLWAAGCTLQKLTTSGWESISLQKQPVLTSKQVKPIHIHPNPVTDRFIVDIPQWMQQVVRFEIFDLKGNQWYSKTSLLQEESYNIDLPAYMPEGEYVLLVRNDAGKRLIGKFLKI